MLAGLLILSTFALAFWGFRRRHDALQPWRVPLAAAGLIVFQALLGMWTVTWKLKPIVVMAHLLGGFATFALLGWFGARAAGWGAAASAVPVRRAFIVVGIVLLTAQIALGGWTSSNYAALACGLDFPTCQGQWWPATDFREAFVLWRGIGVDYEGGVLDGPARTAIHLTHRLFALLVAGHLLALAWRAVQAPAWRGAGFALAALLALQVGLGISNVLAGLPLPVATAHNIVAALLLATLVGMLARATPLPKP
jgi:cytochrome c oxidase assembly protein subunit 15